MKSVIGAALVAGTLSLASTAGAATFQVVDNPGGQLLPTEPSVANFGIYGPTLSVDDSVSITFDGSDMETMVGIGFNFDPLGSRQMFELVFTGRDFSSFGVTDIYLSSSQSITDAYATATISASGQLVELIGTSSATPFWLLYTFENSSNGSFTGDLTIAAVPLPATVLLMLAGLGGLGAMRARRKA